MGLGGVCPLSRVWHAPVLWFRSEIAWQRLKTHTGTGTGPRIEEVSLEASAISGSLNSPKFYYKVTVVYSVMSYDKTMWVEE